MSLTSIEAPHRCCGCLELIQEDDRDQNEMVTMKSSPPPPTPTPSQRPSVPLPWPLPSPSPLTHSPLYSAMPLYRYVTCTSCSLCARVLHIGRLTHGLGLQASPLLYQRLCGRKNLLSAVVSIGRLSNWLPQMPRSAAASDALSYRRLVVLPGDEVLPRLHHVRRRVALGLP